MMDSTTVKNTLVARHFKIGYLAICKFLKSETLKKCAAITTGKTAKSVFLLIAATGFTTSSNALSGCPNADVSNTQAGSFSSLSIVPKLHRLKGINAEDVQPMLFPPLSPFSSVLGTSASQNLSIQLDAGKLRNLMLRLSTGNVLSEVSGDENVVLEPGVIVQGWESSMDAYALLPGGQEPDYFPGASVSLTMINPAVTPVTLPDGFVLAGHEALLTPAAISRPLVMEIDQGVTNVN